MNDIPFLSSLPFLSIFFSFLSFFYWMYVFFILYHLIRFGIGMRPKQLALLFLIGSFALFSAAASLSQRVSVPALEALVGTSLIKQ